MMRMRAPSSSSLLLASLSAITMRDHCSLVPMDFSISAWETAEQEETPGTGLRVP